MTKIYYFSVSLLHEILSVATSIPPEMMVSNQKDSEGFCQEPLFYFIEVLVRFCEKYFLFRIISRIDTFTC